ncbi:MAG TPA: biopolymer transporter ExbD [Candidatus Krumholzibacteria bacterium]|nr:biopolymer transporter ExbD [Candidatus Krumholzibacteria bacterium]
MRRRKRRRLIQEIPQASLPDMAFLLLIFFISATVFGVEHGLPLVLPSAKRSPRISVEPTEVFRIQARADGTVMAEDRVVQVAEIETLLRARNATRLARQQSELIVIVEIHPDAAYELMVSILDQIRAAGSRRVALRSLEE